MLRIWPTKFSIGTNTSLPFALASKKLADLFQSTSRNGFQACRAVSILTALLDFKLCDLGGFPLDWTSSVSGSCNPALVQQMFPLGEACKSQPTKI